ncbi:MAG: signal transduction histidine kinase, nitrogen specific, NtrB [Proteobacteria bacterium]|jgi:two-component system, NtrC family, nitrogen regulation sensor histidine kinase GlnL|nr:signal transduction histidine kinase, nitrogen specific, NtrB [Pseudomonadota bacterium]
MNADVLPQEYDAFDQLATMVAIARSDGHCLLANSTLENAVAVSRRALLRGNVLDWFVDPLPMRETLLALQRNEVTSGRFEAQLKRAPLGSFEPLLVRVSASQMDTQDWVLLEIVEIEQQTRQDREERALGLAQANKELLRNLAHEIKNPLGGIRGAAQLLEMELNTRPNALARLRGGMSGPKPTRAAAARGLTEYTQVIIHEADRLQALVDRLLAPHRKPHVVGDVNIHEVCERVRLLISSEFPRGLEVQRDYDTSIPEFRGDREQLIQAVLNIVRNATEALAEQIAAGSARLVLRTRIARQVTIGKQRYRLALELHVQDNGPGVPEPIRDRIFHPLVSGREGGSGLGLTLAQTFVQQHRGTIEYDSVPGRTNFKILIPLP